MNVFQFNNKDQWFPEILETLRKGGVIVFPSDTVYGLLCDTSNMDAVRNLLEFKERPPGKAISVFCGTKQRIAEVCEVSSESKQMLDTLLPGLYTIVLPSKHVLDKRLESETGTLGVRIPAFEAVNELVNAFGKPLTATSANLSGDSPHYSVDSLMRTLSEKKKSLLAAVVDAGKLPRNKPSTVVDLTRDNVTVLRVGDTLLQQKQVVVTKSEEDTKAVAVNLISQHSNAGKPLVFILKGDLGTGKTIFTKGIAGHLGIEDVVSPTFVIYYEYEIPNSPFKMLYHFDLYNIMTEEEFKHVGIELLMKPGSLFVFEWGEKLGKLYDEFKEKAEVVYIELEHTAENERQLTIHMDQP